jgi:chromosome segregation ATPase
MTKTTDMTVKLLEQIRDEIRGTRESLSTRIDATNERLDATNERLDATNKQTNERIDGTNARLDGMNARALGVTQRLDRMEKRQIESEMRLSTELTAVVGAVNGVRDLLRERLDERDRLDDHERRLRVLERGPAGH